MLDPSLIENYNKTRPFAADKFCYAPFSSLYFGHEGKVTACCENREHLLGVYPQQSISEIWNGESANQLRQYISEQNLWHGCKGCDFDLRSGNYGGIHARIFDNIRIHQKDFAYPGMLEFELENTCNLECVMCTGIFSSSIRKNRERLPPILSPYDATFVKQLEEFIPHLSLANFFGGEPFLVELYYNLWEKMATLNPGMNVWVTTNCTILNNRVKDLLSRLRFNLTCSIDSLEKSVYEKIRVNANFERVMENLEYFLHYTKSNNTDFTLNTCPMPQNWKGLPDIVKWGNEKGVVVNIIPVRSPEPMSLRSLPSETLNEIVAYYRTFNFPENDKYSRRNKKNFEDYQLFAEQWMHYLKEMELKNSASIGSQPMRTIINRITTNLHFSSGSLESKEGRIKIATDKISSIQKKFENISPELGQAVWNMALHSSIEELLYALFTWSEHEILLQAKQGVGQIIDQLTGQSEELTHFKRLNLYLKYLQASGTHEDLCNAALERWKYSLLQIKNEDNKRAENILTVLNKKEITQFANALLAEQEKAILVEWQQIAV